MGGPEDCSDSEDRLAGPAGGRQLGIDERQHFTAVFSESALDRLRRVLEASVAEVAEKGDHCRTPRTPFAKDDATAADDFGRAAANERHIFRTHATILVADRCRVTSKSAVMAVDSGAPG
jgi:hypothetical protein